MNSLQDLKRLILPFLKGLPIILAIFAISLAIAYRSVLYTNPMYESTAKIKLDDVSHGISSSSLYEDFDVFTNTNKIAAEVEILKSKLLIEKTLEKLDFDVTYFRVGKIRTRELYRESPFIVEYKIRDDRVFDKRFDLKIESDSTFSLFFTLKGKPFDTQASFGDTLSNEAYELIIRKNDQLLTSRSSTDLLDRYQFCINSMHRSVEQLIGGNLDVTSVDEDVAVVRVSYKCEVPEKSSRFVNVLSQTYVEDYVENRTGAARKTVRFIDNRLDIIAKELSNSEMKLETYRLDNNIINTRQETETDLRKIAQMKIQLANLEMNEAAIDSLYEYTKDPKKDFLDIAPNFEAFNDLLSTELIKKMKQYQSEKKDLLIKYTAEDEKVMVIDRKIMDIEKYIRESIANTKKNITVKRKEIQSSIEEAEKIFVGLPTKEKQMVILERNFQLNQKIFNFLTEKRTEASIAEAATISFHRIIQKAYTPTHPVSPKKTLTMIVAGFLGLIIGISFVYIRVFIGGKFQSRDEIEKIASTPVAGIIKKYKKNHPEVDQDFQALVMNLKILDDISKHDSILITSSIAGEGKTFTVRNLARAYGSIDWKVAVVDLNFRNPQLHKEFGLADLPGISEVIEGKCDIEETYQSAEEGHLTIIPAGNNLDQPMKLINHPELEKILKKLKMEFDLVIIDSPATTITPDAIRLMSLCNHVYYIVKANYTKSHFILNADMIAKEYGLDNIKLLVNNVHQATNFNGVYTGSQFKYGLQSMNLLLKAKHYIKNYL
ncbi:MAG: AAA family ATPase [Chitinophagales bacterium]|nr:AAA family ATPase [Chitinophagales bacterium]